MPLPWVRLDTSIPRNHKILALLQDKDGYRAFTVYVCSMAYSGEQGTAGFIPDLALPFIHGRKADAERLVKHGFWEPDPGGWTIHDWAGFQAAGEEAEMRKRKARDAAYARWGKSQLADASGNAASMPGALPEALPGAYAEHG